MPGHSHPLPKLLDFPLLSRPPSLSAGLRWPGRKPSSFFSSSSPSDGCRGSPSPRVPRPESSVRLSSPGWAGTRPAAAQALSLMGMRSGQEPLYYCGTRDACATFPITTIWKVHNPVVLSTFTVYSLPLSGSRTFLSPQKDPLNPLAVTPNLASLHS